MAPKMEVELAPASVGTAGKPRGAAGGGGMAAPLAAASRRQPYGWAAELLAAGVWSASSRVWRSSWTETEKRIQL